MLKVLSIRLQKKALHMKLVFHTKQGHSNLENYVIEISFRLLSTPQPWKTTTRQSKFMNRSPTSVQLTNKPQILSKSDFENWKIYIAGFSICTGVKPAEVQREGAFLQVAVYCRLSTLLTVLVFENSSPGHLSATFASML